MPCQCRASPEHVPAPFLRFDFADTLGLPGPVCFSQPERVIVAHDVSEVIAALRAVEEGTRQGLYAAGYVAYEAAPAFDDALVTRARRSERDETREQTQEETQEQPPDRSQPLVWFGFFRAPRHAESPSAPSSAAPPSSVTMPASSASPASSACARIRRIVRVIRAVRISRRGEHNHIVAVGA